jgi:ABC-type uncharacterized transport system permease subunit
VIASKDHVTAVRLADGESLWEHALPAPPVLWGMALDREGRVVITLQDGQVVSFGTTSVRSEERPVSHRGE